MRTQADGPLSVTNRLYLTYYWGVNSFGEGGTLLGCSLCDLSERYGYEWVFYFP